MFAPEDTQDEYQNVEGSIRLSIRRALKQYTTFHTFTTHRKNSDLDLNMDLSDDSIQMVDSRPLLSSAHSIDGASSTHGGDVFSEDNTQVATNTKAPLKDCILIFFASVGCMICVTAVLSNLVYYTDTMGNSSFFIFNLVLYGPMLPVTILQTLYDGTFDQLIGSSHTTYSFRGTCGFFISSVCLFMVPFLSTHYYQFFILSMVCLCLGIASAVLHGTLKQMASFVYPNCGRLAAAVAAGMQASALPVLVVSIISQFGDGPSQDGVRLFYGLIAVMLLVCWGCFRVLLEQCRGVRKGMTRRDSYLSLNELDESRSSNHETSVHTSYSTEIRTNESNDFGNLIDLSNHDHLHMSPIEASPGRDEEGDRGQSPDECEGRGGTQSMISTWEIWKSSRPACVVVIVTVASSMSVASYFNNVQSQDPANESFPQVIFYTRLLGDLLGRPATLIHSSTRDGGGMMSSLTWMAFTRLSFVPIFFLYTGNADIIPKCDLAAVVGVFVFAFTSGYLVTLSYQNAPSLLLSSCGMRRNGNDNGDHSLLTRQAGLINVCFSVSILIGFALTFLIDKAMPIHDD